VIIIPPSQTPLAPAVADDADEDETVEIEDETTPLDTETLDTEAPTYEEENEEEAPVVVMEDPEVPMVESPQSETQTGNAAIWIIFVSILGAAVIAVILIRRRITG